LRRQAGVAVVTALLLTTLAITIVASLFWQQQVQVRTIENQRLQLQRKWVMRGALDWARLILREDARHSTVDHLKEAWATPLEDTRLDQYVENGREDTEASDATLSGHIIDAQSRFNLNNLASGGTVVPGEVAIFTRLLTTLHIDPQLAPLVATSIAASQSKLPKPGPGSSASQPATSGNPTNSGTTAVPTDTTTENPPPGVLPEVQFLRFAQVDDLLSVNGFTPPMIEKLRDFVVVLPRSTPVNVNTAPPEVLAALLDGVSTSDAAAVVATRDRAYFLSTTDFKGRFGDLWKSVPETDIATVTSFFIVNGKVRLSRSMLDVDALVERSGDATKILWVKEN
jgi:general secretion pathway protein K